jgi:hypothetical protein
MFAVQKCACCLQTLWKMNEAKKSRNCIDKFCKTKIKINTHFTSDYNSYECKNLQDNDSDFM